MPIVLRLENLIIDGTCGGGDRIGEKLRDLGYISEVVLTGHAKVLNKI